MQKGLLISILLATAIVPLWTARMRDPARALLHTVLAMVGFETVYLFAVLYVYPRL